MTDAPGNENTSLLHDPRLVWGAVLVFWVLGLVRRAFFDFVPGDFSAYLHAADLFVDGQNPYTDARYDAARYAGFPYNYFPGTLYLIAPIAFMSSALAASLEWVLRGVLVFGSVLGLGRIFPERQTAAIMLVFIAHEPFVVDSLVGNVATTLFAGFIALAVVSERPRDRWTYLAAFFAGVAFGFKPFWYLPAGFLLLARRRFLELIVAFGGTLVVVALSLLHLDWYPAYTAHTLAMRDFYTAIDVLTLMPAAYPVVLALGAMIGAWLLVKRPHPDLWLLGTVSMPIWPRLATYSYVLTIPFVLYLMRRLGTWRGLVASAAVVGPVPWLVRDSGLLPSTQAEGVLMFVWALVASIGFVVIMAKEGGEGRHAA